VCGAGLSCSAGNCTPTGGVCGDDGEVCCIATPRCAGNLTCNAGTCGALRCVDPYGETKTYDVKSAPESIAVGDLDADGDADLAVCGGSSGLFVMRNGGAGTFKVGSAYPASSCYRAVVADFDEDGKSDLAVSRDATFVTLFHGPGPLTTAWRSLSTGNGSLGLAVADFDKDAHLDLVTANQADATVSVLLGNGDGTFAAKSDYSAEATAAAVNPLAVAVGDFNEDGWPDLAVTTLTTTAGWAAPPEFVQILLNSGTGTFLTATPVISRGPSEDLAAADLNGDGHLDLVTAELDFSNASVLLGNGDGTFQPGVDYPSGYGIAALELADLDGTGGPELVLAGYESATVGVLSGNTDGTFGASIDYAIAPRADGLATADFDGDGDLDLAVSSFQMRSVQILTNDGTGALSATPVTPLGAFPPKATVAARLDGDAYPDLAFVTYDDALRVLRGRGDGTFDAATVWSTGAGPAAVAAGDVDGDGFADLVTANGGGTVSVLLGNGDGTFAPRVDATVGGNLQSVAVGDFDGDLDDDVAIVDTTANTTYFLASNGDGTLQPKATIASTEGGLRALDLDGDGKLDLTVMTSLGYSYLLGNGDGTFAAPVNQWSAWEDQVAFGDVDGDDDLDVVYSSYYSPSSASTYAKGAGASWTWLASRSIPANTAFVAMPDVDGDGRADIVAARSSDVAVPTFSVYLNEGDGTDLATYAPIYYGVGMKRSDLLVVDLDADGRDDLVAPSQVTWDLRVMMSRCP
jgi:hypothetical protein